MLSEILSLPSAAINIPNQGIVYFKSEFIDESEQFEYSLGREEKMNKKSFFLFFLFCLS
jgi:hypothetical protein